MSVAVRLLERQGRADLTATVAYRYSRTMRKQQLTNGCQHCDALQGNFPVHGEALTRVTSAGGPDTLLVVGCPHRLPGAFGHGVPAAAASSRSPRRSHAVGPEYVAGQFANRSHASWSAPRASRTTETTAGWALP